MYTLRITTGWGSFVYVKCDSIADVEFLQQVCASKNIETLCVW